MALDVRLATQTLSAPAELERFLTGRTGDGAVVTFTGLARGIGKDGSTVESLTLDWYPGMTERSMLDIAEAWSIAAATSSRARPSSSSLRPRRTDAWPSRLPTI